LQSAHSRFSGSLRSPSSIYIFEVKDRKDVSRREKGNRRCGKFLKQKRSINERIQIIVVLMLKGIKDLKYV